MLILKVGPHVFGYWWMTLVLSILALIFYIAIVGKAVSAILAAEYFETYDFGNLLPLMLLHLFYG